MLLLFLAITINLQGQKIDLSKEQVVEEGVGLTEYPLDKTRLSTVIADFGENYEREEYPKDSVWIPYKDHPDGAGFWSNPSEIPALLEVKYKDLGLSFYYLSTDSTQMMRAIKFSAPFKMRTKKGLVLNQSTLGDVLEVYENGRMLVSGNPPVSVGINKFLDEGIRFTSKLAGYGKDEFPSNDLLKKKLVEEIYVYNFQDKIFLGSNENQKSVQKMMRVVLNFKINSSRSTKRE